MITGDPPFEVEDDVDGQGYWMRPHQAKTDARRKGLRKHVLTSLMLVLAYVVKHRPRLLVGVEQGGLIAALCSLPLLLEVACRQRVAETRQMQMIRQTWAGVSAIISINPIMLPQRSEAEEVQVAVPEVQFSQPRNII